MGHVVPGILRRITADKMKEVARAKEECSLSILQKRLEGIHGGKRAGVGRRGAPGSPIGFASALSGGRIDLIAELKRSSPSRGELVENFAPCRRARDYELAGAAAISVLTDGKYFGGRLNDLEEVREAVDCPLLRKDFIIDPYQVHEARLAGGNAVLLIAAVLDAKELVGLAELCVELGMDPLIEVHNERELDMVLTSDPGSFVERPLLGINNRNLHTFEVDLGNTEKMISRIPEDFTVISESGISSREDVARLEALGVDAILVGEALMRAVDPQKEIRRLLPHLAGGEG